MDVFRSHSDKVMSNSMNLILKFKMDEGTMVRVKEQDDTNITEYTQYFLSKDRSAEHPILEDLEPAPSSTSGFDKTTIATPTEEQRDKAQNIKQELIEYDEIADANFPSIAGVTGGQNPATPKLDDTMADLTDLLRKVTL